MTPEPHVIRDDPQLYREGIPRDRPVLLLAPRWDITATLNNALAACPRNVVGMAVVLNPRRHRIVEIEP